MLRVGIGIQRLFAEFFDTRGSVREKKMMVLIMMRTQYNETGFKGIVNDPRNNVGRPPQALNG